MRLCIYAFIPRQIITYLQEALRNAGTNETVQHGACLGLGLAAMATGGADLYEDLKNTLYMDSANAGEAAAYAIGLTMLGKGGTTPESRVALEEMIAYAHDTAHEKIIRGLAMGIALTLYRYSTLIMFMSIPSRVRARLLPVDVAGL